MKRLIFIIISTVMISTLVYAADEPRKDPNQLFYAGNSYYEKGQYAKAVDEYLKIFDTDIESGNLYYNIGNSFFKLGKLGYAILYYERAKRLMPQDGDLRANLVYAKSSAGLPDVESSVGNMILGYLNRPFRDFNLNAMAISGGILYIIAIALSVMFILNRFMAKKIWIIYVIVFAFFTMNAAAFAARYYDEHILRHGIVVERGVECKYEPIDKSTTYYTLQEGADVIVLKARSGWCQIKRADGRIAWAKKEAVEEI